MTGIRPVREKAVRAWTQIRRAASPAPPGLNSWISAKVSSPGTAKGRHWVMYELNRFFRTLKYGGLYIKGYETPKEMITGIRSYIKPYSTLSPHGSLGAAPLMLSASTNRPITQIEQGVRI